MTVPDLSSALCNGTMTERDEEISRRAGAALLAVGGLLTAGFIFLWVLMDRSGDPLYGSQSTGEYTEPIQETYGLDSVGTHRTPDVQIEPLPAPPAATRPADVPEKSP